MLSPVVAILLGGNGVAGGGCASAWLADHVAGLLQDDAAFLEWADSGGGRAVLAAGLRALRTRAAAGQVAQVWGVILA
jgi:hypothetical protein